MEKSCSWCHALNIIPPGAPVSCRICAHRADVPRPDCDCPRCRPQYQCGIPQPQGPRENPHTPGSRAWFEHEEGA